MNKINVDCYYFYSSKCSKGDACSYRHCEAARGSDQTCSEWQNGTCSNIQCPLRHMKLTAAKSQTPCYWENTPSGCIKSNCPFLHTGKTASNQSGLPGHPQSNPNLHVIVSLADSEESEDEQLFESSSSSPPQQQQTLATNETAGNTTTKLNNEVTTTSSTLATVTHGGSNRRVVLPIKSSTTSQHPDNGVQQIAVIAGGRVATPNNYLRTGDLRRVLAGSQPHPPPRRSAHDRLSEKPKVPPPVESPEELQRRQSRLKRFSAGGEAVAEAKQAKTESKSQSTSSEKPENDSVANTTTSSSPQNATLLDEDELLGDISASGSQDLSEHLNGDDLIGSV